MLHDLSISTVWNALRSTDGECMIAELAGLGFAAVELNFQVSPEIMQGVLACVRSQRVRISSVHNYCPVPPGVQPGSASPDVPSLAAPREDERQQAVALTRHTIAVAADCGAAAVVVHGGRVDIETRTRELIRLFNSIGPDSKRFSALRNEAVDDRRQHVKEHFDALATSISELVPFARERGIRLGLENRFYYRELPLPDEIMRLLRYFNDGTVGYWHDIGHAYILEKLGFFPPQYYLSSLHKKMVGVHIHDIIAMADHQAPFKGDFDWRLLRYYAFGAVIKVFEVHPSVSREEIRQSALQFSREILTP